MSENVTIDELKEALSAPTVGLYFLEKVMLALIDAHPVDDGRTRDERLRAAMHAVQGDYYRHGKKGTDDRLLLHWMADQCARREGRLRLFALYEERQGHSRCRTWYVSLGDAVWIHWEHSPPKLFTTIDQLDYRPTKFDYYLPLS